MEKIAWEHGAPTLQERKRDCDVTLMLSVFQFAEGTLTND